MEIFNPLISKEKELIEEIRDNLISSDKRVYFDYTATALGYKKIENRIAKLMNIYSNIHSDENSDIAKVFYKAMDNIKIDLNIKDDFSILFEGYGATGAIKKAMDILGIRVPIGFLNRIKNIDIDKPVIMGGPYEHHSNILGYKENPYCDYYRISDNNGNFNIDIFKKKLEEHKGREVIVSISLCSNITGRYIDIKEVYIIAKQYNALVLVDIAALAPYKNIDSQYYDMAFISAHKFLGGVSTPGILVVKNKLLGKIPSFGGGGTVKYVSRSTIKYKNNIFERENPGTQDILGIIKASLAIQLRNEIGEEYISRIKKSRSERLYHLISKLKNIKIYTKKDDLVRGIISFNISNKNHYDIARILLKEYNIEVRAGCSCAGPYGHDLLNKKDMINPTDSEIRELGWIRVSIHYTHTTNDIDYLADKIKIISEKI